MLLPLTGDQVSSCTSAGFSLIHRPDKKANGFSGAFCACCPSPVVSAMRNAADMYAIFRHNDPMRVSISWVAVIVPFTLAVFLVSAQNIVPHQAAASYSLDTSSTTPDPIAALNSRIYRGLDQLDFQQNGFSYLKAVLDRLDVRADSQVLVFSKTSQQFEHISPATPRAIYFNDDVAVAYVQGGSMLELVAPNKERQLSFYTLDTAQTDKPHFALKGYECARCHQSEGMMVTSTRTTKDGTPVAVGGPKLFNVTDQSTPFADRWSGWYVTGTHGSQVHLGNAIAFPDDGTPQFGQPGTQNLESLAGRLDVTRYLAPTSDIVALMTLEHQTEMTNRMLKAEPSSVEDLVAYLLFVEEDRLAEPVNGLTTFAATFASRGPRDTKGRSLRDFDLRTRLFKYPLSYMIYSKTFDNMPESIRQAIYQRLYDILTGRNHTPRFARLLPDDRRAILEILRDTKPALPGYWYERSSASAKSQNP